MSRSDFNKYGWETKLCSFVRVTKAAMTSSMPRSPIVSRRERAQIFQNSEAEGGVYRASPLIERLDGF